MSEVGLDNRAQQGRDLALFELWVIRLVEAQIPEGGSCLDKHLRALPAISWVLFALPSALSPAQGLGTLYHEAEDANGAKAHKELPLLGVFIRRQILQSAAEMCWRLHGQCPAAQAKLCGLLLQECQHHRESIRADEIHVVGLVPRQLEEYPAHSTFILGQLQRFRLGRPARCQQLEDAFCRHHPEVDCRSLQHPKDTSKETIALQHPHFSPPLLGVLAPEVLFAFAFALTRAAAFAATLRGDKGGGHRLNSRPQPLQRRPEDFFGSLFLEP
mmetsp:Transcript_9893/g.28088  ORF Transcript_9893/g.28088 Transcript_9893/m.28088 type:complete len:272 (-) Transcript_9893:656-1471(-)